MGNIKAQYEFCRKCENLAKIELPGGSTQLYCMAGACSNIIQKGTIIGVLKARGKDYHGKEREPRFSNRGPWSIPNECPWYLQHTFVQVEKNEGIKTDT